MNMKMKPQQKPEPPHNLNLEGFGSLCTSSTTPGIMRDCLRAVYWNNPQPADAFKAAGRLADDFKRRGFSQQQALEFILERFSEKFLLKPKTIEQISAKVSWVFTEQEHGLTCSGALAREGLCLRPACVCRYYEDEKMRRENQSQENPPCVPPDVESFLEGHHPTEAIYAKWTYRELMHLERERNCIPGDFREPVLIGFRNLALRVAARNKAPGYDRNTAVVSMHLLQECGLVRKSVQGVSGRMRRQANGYVRVLPISPKYNPESENTDPYINNMGLHAEGAGHGHP